MPPGDKGAENDNNKTSPAAGTQQQQAKRKKETEVARDQAPILRKGEVLQGLFEIEEQFGGGGFGQVYKVNHREYHQKMALKVEPAKGDVRRAKLEMTVMMMLRGKSHIPILYGCGKVRGCPYIVMQVLGRNLSDLRRRQPERNLSGGTVFRVSAHVVLALRHLHECGYVHRDVKPSNCCMGIGSSKRKAFLIDFGMVRRIRDMDGKLRPPRKYAPFRGTVRYVSIAMHNRKEVGFGDDLIGCWVPYRFYAMVELLNGGLPWSSFEKTADILKSKTETPIKDLCDSHPKGLLKFADAVTNLKYEERPKYEKLQLYLRSSLPTDITDASPYDWELNNAPAVSKRPMERSIMASVGTELPNIEIINHPARKFRTPSRTRKKPGTPPPPSRSSSPAATNASPISQPDKKSTLPPALSSLPVLSLPPEPQKTLDVDEQLEKLLKKQLNTAKNVKEKVISSKNERKKEPPPPAVDKIKKLPPSAPSQATNDDEVEKTQASADGD